MLRVPRRTLGMALVALVLLIASVFMMMTAGAGDSVTLGLKQASRVHYNRRTNYAAYGAMQMALDKLTTDLTYSIDPAETGTVTNDTELVYELNIYNNYANNFTNPAPDGRWVPTGMVYIKAKSDFREYPGKYTTTLFSKAFVGANASDYAIVGTDSVYIANSVVDAYWIQKLPTIKLVQSKAGRVTTNSILPNHMAFEGQSTSNATVNCSLKWGPFGDELTVLNITATNVTPVSVWNPLNEPLITKAASTIPARVARYHPPRDPKYAALGGDVVFTGPGNFNLPPGDYKSMTITNGAVVNLVLPASPLVAPLSLPGNDNRYYFADTVAVTNSSLLLQNEKATMPCDIYVGKSFTVNNSTVNWENAPSPNIPAPRPPRPPLPAESPALTPDALQAVLPAPSPAHLTAQEILGPRTMRVFFVGSGAPKFKNCDLIIANNSAVSMHACGKAMKVQILDSVMWGGVKGFSVVVKDSYLHYHRVYY